MKVIKIISKKHGTKNCFVDDEDYNKVSIYKWFVMKRDRTFYAGIWIHKPNEKKKCLLMHRLILNLTERNELCDHVNHNGLDNQKLNLRKCDTTQNNSNTRPSINGTSKYLGVSWDKKRKKWAANLTSNRKKIFLGRYVNELLAAEAYNIAALKIHGKFANLDVIKEDFISKKLKPTPFVRNVNHGIVIGENILYPFKNPILTE